MRAPMKEAIAATAAAVTLETVRIEEDGPKHGKSSSIGLQCRHRRQYTDLDRNVLQAEMLIVERDQKAVETCKIPWLPHPSLVQWLSVWGFQR
jgi:hypothetical protein